MKVFSLKKYMEWNDGKATEWAKDCDGQPVKENSVKGKSGKNYLCYEDGGWCEEVPDTKVIFSGKATVLIKGGKKYVSKCMDGDTYDKEKGLLLCLAKANGISYKDLQEMIEGAKDCNAEKVKEFAGNFAKSVQAAAKAFAEAWNGNKNAQVREVKREAEVGEYIKIVSASVTGGTYSNGDIFKVYKVEKEFGVHIVFCDMKNKVGRNTGLRNDNGNIAICENEYVVLENYKPYKITLSEFWESEEMLAIHCKNEGEVLRLHKTMLEKGFKNKGLDERIAKSALYTFNDKKCKSVAINQAHGRMNAKTVYEFNEVDLEN